MKHTHLPDDEECFIKIEPCEADPMRFQHVDDHCPLIYPRMTELTHDFHDEYRSKVQKSFAYSRGESQQRLSAESDINSHCWNIHRLPLGQSKDRMTSGHIDVHAENKEGYEMLDDDSPARTCPHLGCGRIFPDQASLFLHYNGLHPLSIFLPGKKAAYKCPFCSKKYNSERYMPAHQRREHSTNEGLSSDDEKGQEALIQQSFDSVARRASQLHPKFRVKWEDTAPKVVELRLGPKEHNIRMEDIMTAVDKGFDLDRSPSIHVNQVCKLGDDKLIQRRSSIHDAQLDWTGQRPLDTTDEEDEEHYPESFALDDSEIFHGRQAPT